MQLSPVKKPSLTTKVIEFEANFKPNNRSNYNNFGERANANVT